MSASTLSSPLGEAASRHRLGLLLVTISAVAWSTAGFFAHLIPLDIWTTLFWRGIFGTLTGFVCLVVLERGGVVRAFTGMGWGGLAFTLLSTAGMICFLVALKTTTVAHVAIIYATVPFLSAAMAWIIMRETVSPLTLGAITLAIGGVGITIVNGLGEGSILGDASAFMMTLFMAASIIVVRRSRAPIPTLSVACASAFLGSLFSLPLAAPLSVSAQDLTYLALFGASNMGLGLICFMLGAKRIPAAQTALIGALDAPLAPIWVWLAFGEVPRLTTIVGGAVVLVAVAGHIVLENGSARWRGNSKQ